MDEEKDLATLVAEYEAAGTEVEKLLAKGDAITEAELERAEKLQAEQEAKGEVIKAKRSIRQSSKAALDRLRSKSADLKKFTKSPIYYGDTVETDEGTKRAAINPRTGRIELIEAEADRTKSFGDFLKQVALADIEKQPKAMERLERVYKAAHNSWAKDTQNGEIPYQTREGIKTLNGTSGVAGGYTIPTQFYNQLMELAGEEEIMSDGALTLPMDVDECEIPCLDQSTAPSAGNTSTFGGVVANWTADTLDADETEPKFNQAKLTCHEIAGYTEVTRKLVLDSPLMLEALLYRLFGSSIAWYKDYAFMRGNGVGKPLGYLNSPCLITTAARGSASAITLANVTAVWTRMPARMRNQAVWLVSQAAETAILNMTGVSNQVFIPNGYVVGGSGGGSVQAGLSMLLFGRPVIVTEKLPALNVDGDFCLVHRPSYVIGQRNTLEIAASEHFKFRKRLMSYVFVQRVGGMPWLRDKITIADGTTTLSPFVVLGKQ